MPGELLLEYAAMLLADISLRSQLMDQAGQSGLAETEFMETK